METTVMILVPFVALVALLYGVISFKVKIRNIDKKTIEKLKRFNEYHNLKEGDDGYIDPEETLKEFKNRYGL